MTGQLLLVALGLVTVAWLTFLFHLRPATAVGVVAGVAVLDSIDPRGLSVALSGISVFPSDVVAAALALAAVARLTVQRSSRLVSLVAVLAVLLALGMARALPESPLPSVVNASRASGYFLAALVFAAVQPWDRVLHRSFTRCWQAAGAVLVAVALWHTARFGVDTYGTEAGRALTGSAALVLAQAALITLLGRHEGDRAPWTRWAPAVGLVALLVSQQRTVWVVTVVCLVVVVLRARRFRVPSPDPANGDGTGPAPAPTASPARFAAGVLGLLVIGAVVLATYVGIDGRVGLGRAITEPTMQESSLTWRTDGWVDMVGRHLTGPAGDLLTGQPAGTGFERPGRLEATVSAHSMFVTALISTGLVGLVAFVVLALGALRGAVRAGRAGVPGADTLALLVVSQLVFGVSYQLRIEQGLVLGFAVAAAFAATPAGRTVGAGERDDAGRAAVAGTGVGP